MCGSPVAVDLLFGGQQIQHSNAEDFMRWLVGAVARMEGNNIKMNLKAVSY